MLLSSMLAIGLTSLLQEPIDQGRGHELRCRRSTDPAVRATRDEGCRQSPTSAALRDDVEPSGVAADPDPVVVVRVENPHGVEAPALGGAQELATGIYQRAGVSLAWTADKTREPDRTFTLVLTSSVAMRSARRSDAMGVAPSPRDGTGGTRAYVFVDKVQSFAARYHLVGMEVLACVLAHEIGHLLLPPSAHWPNSVMQDRWHPSLFPSGSPRLLGFTRDQAKLLRRRARSQ